MSALAVLTAIFVCLTGLHDNLEHHHTQLVPPGWAGLPLVFIKLHSIATEHLL
ncbi:hypothetical protein DPMN_027747 [Dreissena polymorpha]|uniref:Uncharacterized protein n=1 Tax=Dreissena polymorpha TaxID=45954 RepID=A0A9D4RDQ8_DREPO|nr:hypothetical protein DPMN_027747 [Dreissena polymorpha]